MSRFRKLLHTIWHCQYHIVWVPKYRYRVPGGPSREAAYGGHIRYAVMLGEVIELNVPKDHVHLIVMVPPKLSISDLMRRLKGQTAIKMFKQFQHLRSKPYWGNHLWLKGYCVDTVGLHAEMIRKYVKYEEEKDRYIERLTLGI